MKRWTLFEIWARTPRIALASFLIFSANIFIVKPCWADDASAKAARELAQKIAAQIDHKKKMTVEIADLTGEMRAADLDDAKRVIEAELRARGCHRGVGYDSYEAKASRSHFSGQCRADCGLRIIENDGVHTAA